VVEHDLAKVGVEGSNPFARSRIFLWQSDNSPTGRRSAASSFCALRKIVDIAILIADQAFKVSGAMRCYAAGDCTEDTLHAKCTARGHRMSRKIILLSDGTGNSAARVWRTNVRRTFEALDLSGNDQIACYDDGVGTSSFKPLAILGGAFGFGLRRNVIALYKFACRNYRDAGDELFGFGFSRGAFTIRIVMGLIDSQGLVKADNEAQLDSLAKAAYRAYRTGTATRT
jgi:Uncharacterized alpha/beta hydrolase domain (DUF2235)